MLFSRFAAIAILASSGAARGVALGDALSIASITCVSVTEITDPIAAPVDYHCDRLPAAAHETSSSRASASTGFGDLISVSAHTECTDCPIETSTWASSRVSYQLAVSQIAAPPSPVTPVPVLITTVGNAAVSQLGLLGSVGTYVSSTEPVGTFSGADVFEKVVITASQTAPLVLADGYDIVQSLDLAPDHTYFVNVAGGCKIDRNGDWACNIDGSASFQLDQSSFDARMGASSFALADYFAVEQSPNLAPEPAAALLEGIAICALVGCAGTRRVR